MNKTTSFCMDIGQVKPGADPADTFNKMLQVVQLSTAGVANSIQTVHPTVQSLAKAFRDHGDDVLRDIPVLRARNGAVTGRSLGPAMSRKMARIFQGTNEWELES